MSKEALQAAHALQTSLNSVFIGVGNVFYEHNKARLRKGDPPAAAVARHNKQVLQGKNDYLDYLDSLDIILSRAIEVLEREHRKRLGVGVGVDGGVAAAAGGSNGGSSTGSKHDATNTPASMTGSGAAAGGSSTASVAGASAVARRQLSSSGNGMDDKVQGPATPASTNPMTGLTPLPGSAENKDSVAGAGAADTPGAALSQMLEASATAPAAGADDVNFDDMLIDGELDFGMDLLPNMDGAVPLATGATPAATGEGAAAGLSIDTAAAQNAGTAAAAASADALMTDGQSVLPPVSAGGTAPPGSALPTGNADGIFDGLYFGDESMFEGFLDNDGSNFDFGQMMQD